jgi:hypothetical protein
MSLGWFDKLARSESWFDETAVPLGWFDELLIPAGGAPVPPAKGSGIVSGVSALIGAGKITAKGSNEINSVSALIGAGKITAKGSNEINSVSALIGAGKITAKGSNEINSVSDLEGKGYIEARGSGNINASSALSGNGSNEPASPDVPDGALTVYSWRGIPILLPGFPMTLALSEDCCCEGVSSCCGCPNLNDLEELLVEATGIVKGIAIMIRDESAPGGGSGQCIRFIGSMPLEISCDFGILDLQLVCLLTGTSVDDLELIVTPDGAGCQPVQLAPGIDEGGTCDPFAIAKTYKTEEIVEEGCPCGVDELFTLHFSEIKCGWALVEWDDLGFFWFVVENHCKPGCSVTFPPDPGDYDGQQWITKCIAPA